MKYFLTREFQSANYMKGRISLNKVPNESLGKLSKLAKVKISLLPDLPACHFADTSETLYYQLD